MNFPSTASLISDMPKLQLGSSVSHHQSHLLAATPQSTMDNKILYVHKRIQVSSGCITMNGVTDLTSLVRTYC